MKKFAMAAVAAAAMTVGVAHAYTAGTFSNGVVVPNVIHNGLADTTAVGLINQSGGPVGVFWTFFDRDSKHVTDGCFEMTDKDYAPFVWANESGLGLEGKRGYLVFVGANGCTPSTLVQKAGALIAAHAFQVNTATKDVAYTPVIDGDLTLASTANLATLGPNDVKVVAGAAQAGAKGDANFSLRYYLQDGAKTNIVVWSTGNQKGTHTVNIYDDKQNAKSVNFKLGHKELDWFDPATMLGRPASFVDGFIEWNANSITALDGASVFTYSLIDAPAFGAVQTVLGFHR